MFLWIGGLRKRGRMSVLVCWLLTGSVGIGRRCGSRVVVGGVNFGNFALCRL